MKLLSEAGVYVAVDVGSPAISLNRENEYTVNASYNDDFLQRVFATTELFSKYDNTLLFFSVVRDIKGYLKERGLRQVPVGYSATDLTENVVELGEYLNCGASGSRADFYAINDYSWCYPSSFEKSGWEAKVKLWKNYGIPLLYSLS
jgi:hypothetical protein